MSDISVNGRIKVSTFQSNFIKKFPYIVPTLRTPDGKGIDNSLTIAGARSKAVGGEYKPSAEAELSVNGNLQVGSFEKRFKAAFGIDCEICYESPGGKLMKTSADHDKLTLSALNAQLKEAGCQTIKL
ncbi:MAG: hypothetical protein RL110_972 [Bacteroidota bacterium]|jgi:hypothetical protein